MPKLVILSIINFNFKFTFKVSFLPHVPQQDLFSLSFIYLVAIDITYLYLSFPTIILLLDHD